MELDTPSRLVAGDQEPREPEQDKVLHLQRLAHLARVAVLDRHSRMAARAVLERVLLHPVLDSLEVLELRAKETMVVTTTQALLILLVAAVVLVRQEPTGLEASQALVERVSTGSRLEPSMLAVVVVGPPSKGLLEAQEETEAAAQEEAVEEGPQEMQEPPTQGAAAEVEVTTAECLAETADRES